MVWKKSSYIHTKNSGGYCGETDEGWFSQIFYFQMLGDKDSSRGSRNTGTRTTFCCITSAGGGESRCEREDGKMRSAIACKQANWSSNTGMPALESSITLELPLKSSHQREGVPRHETKTTGEGCGVPPPFVESSPILLFCIFFPTSPRSPFLAQLSRVSPFLILSQSSS